MASKNDRARRYWRATMDSPVGELQIIATQDGIAQIRWDCEPGDGDFRTYEVSRPPRCLKDAQRQLTEYFEGKRKNFDLPLDVEGTEFQLSVWKVLRRIPYGHTISYGEQARQLGDPKKARAVGGANGKNPVSIIVPCHRVIGKDGSLTGFGGGLSKKQYLLQLESN